MRCPDCQKFVSYDEGEVEIESEEIDDDGLVRITVRVPLPCAECGQDLKEAAIEVEEQIEHDCEKYYEDPEGEIYTLDNVDAEFHSRRQTKDRHGKPIKSYRYQKQFYGAEITGDVTCNRCGEEIAFSATAEEQASYFDELV
jgi:hypothetical protein